MNQLLVMTLECMATHMSRYSQNDGCFNTATAPAGQQRKWAGKGRSGETLKQNTYTTLQRNQQKGDVKPSFFFVVCLLFYEKDAEIESPFLMLALYKPHNTYKVKLNDAEDAKLQCAHACAQSEKLRSRSRSKRFERRSILCSF